MTQAIRDISISYCKIESKGCEKAEKAFLVPLMIVLVIGLVFSGCAKPAPAPAPASNVGLLPGSAVVFTSNSPAVDRFMAAVLKPAYGNRIQICDGSIDNSESIKGAIDALPAAGGTIILGEGAYYLGEIYLPVSKPIKFIGQSGTIFYMIEPSPYPTHMFYLGNGSNVTFENITFDGQELGYRLAAFGQQSIEYMSQLSCDNCIFQNFSGKGICANLNNSSAISNCKFLNNGQDGIYLSVSSVDVNITFNYFGNNARSGIRADNTSRIKVEGNTITGSGDHAIVFEASGGSRPTDIQITNNLIYSNTGSGIIVSAGGHRIEILGNNCNNNTDGISIIDNNTVTTSHISIQENLINFNTRYGIRLAGNISYIQIMGNNIDANILGPFNNASTGKVRLTSKNIGFITENSGTAKVASGHTKVVVNHGLAATPERVYLTPTNSLGNSTKFWVDTLTATQFTINVDIEPGTTTAILNWRAVIGGGN